MSVHVGACGGQKMELYPLELELQGVMKSQMWVPGTEHQSSESKGVLNTELFLQQNSLFGSHTFYQYDLFSKHSYLHPCQRVPSVR